MYFKGHELRLCEDKINDGITGEGDVGKPDRVIACLGYLGVTG